MPIGRLTHIRQCLLANQSSYQHASNLSPIQSHDPIARQKLSRKETLLQDILEDCLTNSEQVGNGPETPSFLRQLRHTGTSDFLSGLLKTILILRMLFYPALIGNYNACKAQA